MIVCFHLITFLANEYFTPGWQKHVRDITREVVKCLKKENHQSCTCTDCCLVFL